MGLERNSGYRLPQNIRELTKDVKISGHLGKETMQHSSLCNVGISSGITQIPLEGTETATRAMPWMQGSKNESFTVLPCSSRNRNLSARSQTFCNIHETVGVSFLKLQMPATADSPEFEAQQEQSGKIPRQGSVISGKTMTLELSPWHV